MPDSYSDYIYSTQRSRGTPRSQVKRYKTTKEEEEEDFRIYLGFLQISVWARQQLRYNINNSVTLRDVLKGKLKARPHTKANLPEIAIMETLAALCGIQTHDTRIVDDTFTN